MMLLVLMVLSICLVGMLVFFDRVDISLVRNVLSVCRVEVVWLVLLIVLLFWYVVCLCLFDVLL